MKRTLLLLSCLFLSILGQGPAFAAEPVVRDGVVRNVIYMIGDGMGLAQVSGMMIEGGYEPINMERAHAVGLIKTYSNNNRVTDSAAAGTALATGSKTNNSRLGIDPDGNALKSILLKAGEDGYKTGFVVTCAVTHATPAAFYANVFSRSNQDTVALQLLDSNIDVFLGGGLKYFRKRKDGKDLIPELEKKGYNVALDFEDCAEVTSGKLAGLFKSGHLPYEKDGRGDYLPRATAKALEILSNDSRNGKGFFLMVEGSLIDYGAHNNNMEEILCETRDFDAAVGVAFDFADRNPGTLVVVLADHETGGMAITPGNADFTLSESGINYKFGTTGHTGIMVPVFAYGTGAEAFSRVCENTDIPKIIERLLLGAKKKGRKGRK